MSKAKKELILELMTTSTGRQMGDSGFEDGRHWQKNRKKELSFDEQIKVEGFDYCSIPIHVYMDTMFSTSPETEAMNELISSDYHWVDDAVEVLKMNGYYSEMEYDTNNTCNGECDLSQGFIYHLFRDADDTMFCIFQLHNGADIRGGYTSAVVFEVEDIDYMFLGMRCDFYDHSTDQQFESVYDIDEEEYIFDEENQGFINKETLEVMYPYSPAMGF